MTHTFKTAKKARKAARNILKKGFGEDAHGGEVYWPKDAIAKVFVYPTPAK